MMTDLAATANMTAGASSLLNELDIDTQLLLMDNWNSRKAAAAVTALAAAAVTPVEEVALMVGIDNSNEEADSKNNLCLTSSPQLWAEATPFQMLEQQQQQQQQQHYVTEDQIQGLKVQQQQQQQQQQPLQPDSDEQLLRMIFDSPPVSPDLLGMDYSNSVDFFSNCSSNINMCSPPPTTLQQPQQQPQQFEFATRRGPRGSLSSIDSSSGYESERSIPSPQSAFDVDMEEEEVRTEINSIARSRRQGRRRPRTNNRRGGNLRRSHPSGSSDDEGSVSSRRIPQGPPTPNLDKAKITVWLARILDSKSHNPRVLSWVDREKGIFKVEDQAELARLWGHAKNNPGMNYEKFSRAMRYYYRRNELVVVRKKLVYQFGSRAAVMREH